MHYGKVLVNLDFPTIEPDSDALQGEKILYYREKKGVSKEELADFLGITQSYISRLEKRIMTRLKRDLERVY